MKPSKKPAKSDVSMVAMNEALVLSSLRQQEMTVFAESANLRLKKEMGERRQAESALRHAQTLLLSRAGQLEELVAKRTTELTATNTRLEASVESIRRAQERAQIMQGKLSQLTRQLLTAQEEERKQISRELHDEVVQTLVSINVELTALGKVCSPGMLQMKKRIDRSQRLVGKSVDAVHRFARGLRPAVLDDLGLIPALLAYSKSLAAREKFKIRITAFAGVEALGDAERTVLFRIAQEALTNVGRHARATQVALTISNIAGAIRMEINDNGRSFLVDKVLHARNNRRLGLLGMRERIEMVGGILTLESTPGKGTTVCAEIPFILDKANR